MSVRLAGSEPALLPAYRDHAPDYDARTSAFHYWRGRIGELVRNDPGATVLDIGCGTGLCFEALRQRTAPLGAVIGVDQSAEVLTLASERVTAAGWDDVRLVEASAEDVELPAIADYVVFCAVHDVLRSDAALANILRQGEAAGGGKFASDYAVVFNALICTTHEPYVADFTGFDRPWSRLADHVEELRVSEVWAVGSWRPAGYRNGKRPADHDAIGSSPSSQVPTETEVQAASSAEANAPGACRNTPWSPSTSCTVLCGTAWASLRCLVVGTIRS